MPLPLSISNGIKVYNLTKQQTTPEWSTFKHNNKRIDIEHKTRISILQDFDFPSSASKIVATADRRHLVAAGSYKPRLKTFELEQLSLKFERFIDSEMTDFIVLSDDYAKMALLRADRFVEFHNQIGCHFKVRIPKNGRNLIYNKFNCDLIISSMADGYRINLEEGRFKAPFKMADSEGLNHSGFSEPHRLYAFAGASGVIEFFDERTNGSICVLKAVDEINKMFFGQSKQNQNSEITRLAFQNNFEKLQMASSTNGGLTAIFDLRKKCPLLIKSHRNDLAVNHVAFSSKNDQIISSDKNSIKIWNILSGEIFTSIISKHPINSFCQFPDSGVIMAACDTPDIQAFFIPQLAEAPNWCSFLDNITEELEEEKQQTVYDDFKFVTKADLEKLGAKNLIGTNSLRPYMHGYFINYKKYASLASIVSKTELDDHFRSSRKKRLEEELAEKISSRRFANRFKNDVKNFDSKNEIAEDDRFKKMFQDENFEIDINSVEYRLRYSSKKINETKKLNQNLNKKLEKNDENNQKMTKMKKNNQKMKKNNQKSEKNPKITKIAKIAKISKNGENDKYFKNEKKQTLKLLKETDFDFFKVKISIFANFN